MADHFLYERVYDYVLDEIRQERLVAGDRVPSETELAEQFGVSRITSKRALRMLADAGVVERQRGRGSFVADQSRQVLQSRLIPEARPDQSRCLGLLIPDFSEAYGLELLCAIEERSAEHGYHLLVRRTRDSQQLEEQAVETLTSTNSVDGLIVFPVHGDYYNASLVRLVLDHSPLVLVDRHLRGIPACAVYTDNVAAARALTAALLDRGHERIGFLSPAAENTSSIEERKQGYEEALRERGFPAGAGRYLTQLRSTLPGPRTGGDERLVDRVTDREAILAFLERELDVTGFVACEYGIAVLLADVLRESAGDRRRDTIACFDSPVLPSWVTPFVHIKQDQREMGRRAVDLLVAQLAGDEVPHRSVVPFALVEPDGTAVAGDPVDPSFAQ